MRCERATGTHYPACTAQVDVYPVTPRNLAVKLQNMAKQEASPLSDEPPHAAADGEGGSCPLAAQPLSLAPAGPAAALPSSPAVIEDVQP